jgi:biopolymer transport protein ExbB
LASKERRATRDNLNLYANVAWGHQYATDVVSNQFLFSDPLEYAYANEHYIPTDHSQTWTGSAGANYVWYGTRFSADMIFGSGLRSGFANLETVPAYAQINVGVSRPFKWSENAKPLTVSFSIVNLLDSTYVIRDGTGIGVFAPQYGRASLSRPVTSPVNAMTSPSKWTPADGASRARPAWRPDAIFISGLALLASVVHAAAADEPLANAPVVAALLPRDLSPWGMFLSADAVVKTVMISLVFASFVIWTVALAKGIEIFAGARKLARQIGVLKSAPMTDAAAAFTGQGGLELAASEARAEMMLSANLDPAGVKERVASVLERAEARAGRRIARATGVLATIGATAPFVGLFGTVWGVMDSFIGISKQHTTNLAVVAPGIAEALLATALGLVAAIPAVVFYNLLARAIAGFRARFADGSAAILRSASRDLDRARPGPTPSVRVRSLATE